MNKKRLFQVLDEMNVNDDANKTETCACCFDLVGANKVKAGGHVTMGVPTEAVLKLLLGEYMPMLVLLDKKEYHRLEDVPVEDKLQAAEARADRYEKALRAIQAKVRKTIFPAKACTEIDRHITELFTPKTDSNE